MPLVVATLEAEFIRIMDPDDPTFITNDPDVFDPNVFPTPEERLEEFKRLCSEEPEFLAGLWADAYDAYCSLVVVGPSPAIGAPLGRQAMFDDLVDVFDPEVDTGLPDFEGSFLSYTDALSFALHSEAAPGTPIPPTGPAMATVAAQHPGPPPGMPSSNAAAASAMATVVDLWTKTNARLNDVSGSPVPFA